MLAYGAIMFLSAFLLFLIQPLIGKYILPWFGGTPSVWTTCMLFFQALLLGGYGYAHALARRWPLRRQARFHLLLVGATVLVLLWLSILPSQTWKPGDDQYPVLRILALLLASIGAPYFLLSSTAPLLQSWFSRTKPGVSPYRLYALSNLGSLLAILSYPSLIEPAISLSRQASVWSAIYAIFAAMCIVLSLKVMRHGERQADAATSYPDTQAGIEEAGPRAGRYILWFSLTACSSLMLLATTAMLCQDLAVVPLLWILPLALYLLSFVLCFQYERIYWRPLFLGGLAASIGWSCFVLSGGVRVALLWQILSYSLTLFTSCMVCHGELVRMKPGARHLTSFYLMVAGGGVLGGILATVVAPYLLKNFWEYHLGLLATALLALITLFRERKGPLYDGRPLVVWAMWAVFWICWTVLALVLVDHLRQSLRFYLGLLVILLLTLSMMLHERRGRVYRGRPLRVWAVWAMLFLSWVVLALVLDRHIQDSRADSVETRRNFFGVLRVLELYKDDPQEYRFTLMHGRIEHGFQFQDQEKRRRPASYYGPDSGVAQAINLHPRRLAQMKLRIGVIGLGTGTMAAFGRQGDSIRFYEINPEVLKLAGKYFTYCKDSPAQVDVVLGDARVSMERERQRNEPQRFDILAVDAFSSDAIPVHLLTRECFQVYRYHMKEDGILAIHITNRYFDLSPIVRSLIVPEPEQAMQALWFHDLGIGSLGTDRTDWVLLTGNRQFLANPDVQKRVEPWADPTPSQKFWTDDYSDLFSVIHERR